tara:strand:- start:2696 stop:2920 length:225 start_codon:yes stop_codon:yes gene_type:complete
MQIGILPKSQSGNYVTFKEGKRAIRTILREGGFKGVKTFRPRSQNRNEFKIEVNGGVITAARKPDAPVIFTANS